jgi:type 1 glutamine amidotransferase
MNRFVASVVAIVILLGARVAVAGAAQPWPPPPLPEADVQKIFDAAPAKATAAPKKARKVLVFWFTPGFKHTVIPCANAAVEVLGRKTGAYTTVLSDDIAVFEPESLAAFDAIIMNNTCGIAPTRELFVPPDLDKLPADKKQAALERDERLKKSFESFVKSGKGLVGLHGATGAFFKWPVYGEMLGAFFKWHPAPLKVRVKLDDPTHPLLAAFGGKGFEIKEECYVFSEPYSREKCRVLLTLEDTQQFQKNPRPDNEYAMAWVKRYGEGRVFYSAFTHFDEHYREPAFLKFHLDGIQYALGDLEADATPSGKKPAQ